MRSVHEGAPWNISFGEDADVFHEMLDLVPEGYVVDIVTDDGDLVSGAWRCIDDGDIVVQPLALNEAGDLEAVGDERRIQIADLYSLHIF